MPTKRKTKQPSGASRMKAEGLTQFIIGLTKEERQYVRAAAGLCGQSSTAWVHDTIVAEAQRIAPNALENWGQ
jgi:uncharacterized protein (DUF1778 family)